MHKFTVTVTSNPGLEQWYPKGQNLSLGGGSLIIDALPDPGYH